MCFQTEKSAPVQSNTAIGPTSAEVNKVNAHEDIHVDVEHGKSFNSNSGDKAVRAASCKPKVNKKNVDDPFSIHS